MAIRVRMPDETFDYVLRADRDSDTPTVFTFRAPSARAQARLTQQVLDDRELLAAMRKAQAAAKAAGGDGADVRPEDLEPFLKGQAVDIAKTVDDYLELLRDCLVSIGPLFDLHGKPIAMTAAQYLQVADFGSILELGPAALSRGTLSEADAKNSDAQPEPSPAATAAPAVHA